MWLDLFFFFLNLKVSFSLISWILFSVLVTVNILRLVANMILVRLRGAQEPEDPVNVDPPRIPQVKV